MPLLRERMGNGCSRVKFSARKSPWRRREAEPAADPGPSGGQQAARDDGAEAEDGFPPLRPADDTERELLDGLRTLARDQPHVFLLDNLLLAIRLFADYETEVARAQEQLVALEQRWSEKLHPKKKALMVDALREHFRGRVSFNSHCRSENEEQTAEPLRPIQVYLIYENVLVAEREAHYFTPGEAETDYTFILKETEQKGYVRLEKPQGSKELINGNLSSIAENEDEIYSNGESVVGTDEEIYDEHNPNGTFLHDTTKQRFSKKQNPSSASSSSSGYTTNGGLDSDSDSSYQKGREPGGLHEVPSHCLKRVTYDDSGKIYEGPKANNRHQRRCNEKKRAFNRDVIYVNAYRFANHYRAVFRHHMAAVLDFDKTDIMFAGRTHPAVYLEKIDYLRTKDKRQLFKEQFEMIPCFSSPWPKWAGEWMDRQRGSWPSDEVVRKIGRYNCHLVPSCTKLEPGSAPERAWTQDHQLWKLNWRLSFPRAERHLESCLSSTQVTVYAIALMLHKTFISRRSRSHGLDQSHIKNMMFLKVEEQPVWEETDMGKKMIDLLKSLHRDIKQRSMRDYFMPERNLFADTPEDELLHSQKQLQRIMENPVMFVFHAMEKIEYECADYPRLDYRQLIRLLTLDVLALINPNLEACSKAQETQGEANRIYANSKGKFWFDAKQTGQSFLQSKTRGTVINPEKGLDSTISIQEKCEILSRTRLSLLLSFFSEHFLEMARSCHRLSSAPGKELYLRRVRLFALLLAEDKEYVLQARQLVEEAGQMLAQPTLSADRPARTKPPQTPRRNADPPIFVRPFNERLTLDAQLPTKSNGAATTNGEAAAADAETTEF